MLPHCEDPLKELDAERCRAVAAAALSVAALMNAPPGFLEFLLCVPWRKLSQLPKSDSIDKLISNLRVTEEERRRLVNTRLQPCLLRTVLDFLYKADHADSVPPCLQLSPTATAPATEAAGAAGRANTAGVVSGAATSSAAGLVQLPALAAAVGEEAGQVAPGSPSSPSKPAVTLETVAALLDGATPLHCAAIRGNPAQLEHLLSCGADPSLRTAAGELPLELVPACGAPQPGSKQRECCCMGVGDQEVWECRSASARSLIARRCAASPLLLGPLLWLKMLFLCLLCCLGWWGRHLTICRPQVERHVLTRQRQKRQEARVRAQLLLTRMRAEAKLGHQFLAVAKQEAADSAAAAAAAAAAENEAEEVAGDGDGDGEVRSGRLANMCSSDQQPRHSALGDARGSNSWHVKVSRRGKASSPLSFLKQGRGLSSIPMPTSVHDINAHLKESEAVDAQGHEQASEKAFKCFVRAVHALQNLDLQGDTQPQALSGDSSCAPPGAEAFWSSKPGSGSVADASGTGSSPGGGQGKAVVLVAGGPLGGAGQQFSSHVMEDEQAVLYCCWAESVLLKFSRTCTCPGCAALAVQAVRMAHLQATRLYHRAEQKQPADPECCKAVGVALGRVVYVHICLLLETDAQASPTRAAVWRADTCLREWDRLNSMGLLEGMTPGEWAKVDSLQQWTKTADSDLYIAEALLGAPLAAAQSLQDVLASTVAVTDDGLLYLQQGLTHEVVTQLEQAITLALTPSPAFGALTKALAANSARELVAGARLKEIIQGTRVPAGECTAHTLALLMEAINAAEPFPRLRGDLAACYSLQDKWSRRHRALTRLEAVMDQVRHFACSHPLSSHPLPPAVAQPAAPGAGVGARATAPRTRPPPGLTDSPACPGYSAPDLAAEVAAELGKLAMQAAGNGVASCPNTAAGGGLAGQLPGANTLLQGAGQQQQQQQEVCPEGQAHAVGSEGRSWAAEWDVQVQCLEAAIAEAKDANISVNKAKRLLKELQAQSAGAEAARQLEAIMSERPAGTGAIRAALSRAEVAASTLASLKGASVADSLTACILLARKRLDVEKAADGLCKATATCKAVSDLPRLEAAILNARKVGAEELDPVAYRTASEARARLHDASRARSALDAAQRNLTRSQRSEDAEALEKALSDASRWEELLGADLARARTSLDTWRLHCASQAKLSRALREGPSSAALSRAIQEAAAQGLRVVEAKRLLKLLQGLEAAMAGQGAEGAAAQLALLNSRIEACEAGALPGSFPTMQAAARAVKRLTTASAREALEAALKPHSDWSSVQRVSALQAALQQAEALVGTALISTAASPGPTAPGSSQPPPASLTPRLEGEAGVILQAAGAAAQSSLHSSCPTQGSKPELDMPPSSQCKDENGNRAVAVMSPAAALLCPGVHGSGNGTIGSDGRRSGLGAALPYNSTSSRGQGSGWASDVLPADIATEAAAAAAAGQTGPAAAGPAAGGVISVGSKPVPAAKCRRAASADTPGSGGRLEDAGGSPGGAVDQPGRRSSADAPQHQAASTGSSSNSSSCSDSSGHPVKSQQQQQQQQWRLHHHHHHHH
ncbi:hypothetical protein V8C86DRAFT_1058572 [Haematococcus lacustris]